MRFFIDRILNWFYPIEKSIKEKKVGTLDMCSVFEVAKYICEAGNWSVSNLRLQKMLYITQVLFLGRNGRHLFRSVFEAWDYGPVVPEVYQMFKKFGSNPIEKWSFPECEDTCSASEKKFVQELAQSMSRVSSANLVALTHRKGSGWEKNYLPGNLGIKISEEDMKREYKDLWLKNAEQRCN